jgi:hypothetical protein
MLIVEPPIFEAFFECGIVEVLIDLLSRDRLWPELTAAACILTNFTISNHRTLNGNVRKGE